MHIVESLKDIPEKQSNLILTMGNFDGVHLGHQALLKEVICQAERKQGTSVLLTFRPHPISVIFPERKLMQVSNFDETAEQVKMLGLDYIVLVKFTQEISRLVPLEFLRQLICDQFCPSMIIIGKDHRFGRNREGNAEVLESFGKTHGIEVLTLRPIAMGNIIISSSHIRKMIRDGDLKSVKKMLGRSLRVTGIVRRGYGRGQSMGFPTANLNLVGRIIPPAGVYATRAGAPNQLGPAVSYIGDSPTFKQGSYQVETHLFGVQQNLYGRLLVVDFLEKIRSEIKFKSKDELITRMKDDAKEAMSIYKGHN